MKIAYSGSHGTGKTTKVISKALEFKKSTSSNIFLLQELARHSPFAINKTATRKSQLWLFSKQIEQELEMESKYDIIICDRTVLDVLAYTQYLGYYDILEVMKPLAFHHLKSYDQIIYSKINDDYLIEDGVRDTSKEFRDFIDRYLIQLYQEGYNGELIYE